MDRSEATPRTPLGNEPAFEGGATEVAPATWAWIQPNGELGESNAGLVVGEGESLLIDTLWDERLTTAMLNGLAPAREGAPIRTLFNTHGDGDHWYGNGRLAGAEIVSTEAAAEQMEAEPPAMVRRLGALPTLAGLAGSLPLLPGRAGLRGLARFGKALSRYRFEGIEPRLPTRRFSGRTTVDVGGRQVELVEVGPAHTAGDAIAWLADERVLFSGDIVFNGVTPIIWAGPVENWIAALERIERLEPRIVVPGHGPPCGSDRVADLRAYLEYLSSRVPAGSDRAPGELADELLRSAEYRSSPWGSWRAPERTAVNVAMIARRRGGNTDPIGTVDRIRLLAAMGAQAERLGAAG